MMHDVDISEVGESEYHKTVRPRARCGSPREAHPHAGDAVLR
jgi:hypothetical protein